MHKFKESDYLLAAIKAKSIAQMCKNLNIKPCGGNYKLIHHKIKLFNIDISHFTGQGWNKGLAFRPNPPKELKDILIEYSNYQSFKLKKRLISEGYKESKCECCKRIKWNGVKIPTELHHINGINTDNRLENLQILCPNCHALTDNYRAKNKINSPMMKLENITDLNSVA